MFRNEVVVGDENGGRQDEDVEILNTRRVTKRSGLFMDRLRFQVDVPSSLVLVIIWLNIRTA